MVEFKPVVFRLGMEEYGVDINVVRGIENPLQIVPIHNINKNIKGIINLRGSIIPVYSLRTKFNMPEATYMADAKFIIVKASDDMLIALEVDMVEDIQNIADENIHQIPKIISTSTTAYYDKIINLNGRLIVMLDVSKLLDEGEKEELQKAIEKI
ncbi:MAG: purine-binding chemotaxis protein CheW [Lachnospiraceae bacterium]|nr:purine-binding chemotaxis protein CheW [Lachnospiraceae bacterium]